ncbi:BamA/TamA family outer membrane protein [Fibrobacter sp. UBA4309]|uniref:BamA/TamA family outer membrane protein n=1 Tax=Fibrobacter sp. UBA4309 TaxID=1946537 RepID=UPI0025C2599C|nr:BamA/TamA family outer membrane protein [Fibrobacter sp. UBA4309]
MTKKLISLLLLFFVFAQADENVKHPWYTDFFGNELFSKVVLDEQLDIPEEFGQLDTTKQDFMMLLSSENIKSLYYSRGYFSLEMKMDIRREYYSLDSMQRGYLFTIKEGDRYKFNGVKITGSTKEDVEIKQASLNTNQNRYFEQEDIDEDIQYILTSYRRQGYLHVYVTSTELLDTVEKKIYVEINVESGPKVIMGNIVSTTQQVGDRNHRDGDEGLTDTAWLSSLWRIPKGETIDGNQYNSFKNKLLSTQLFTQIKLSDSLRNDGLSDVHLDVVERIPGEARYGIFYEEIYGFGAHAFAKHKNFFGTFNEFSTNFQVAQHKQEISFGYANPLLFGTSFTFIPTAIRFEDRLTFNHEKINPPAYPDSIEERYEVINRGDLTFGITSHIRFRGTVDTRYVNKNDDQMFKFKGEVALTFDYTDDYFNPTKGIRFAPTTGIGTNLTASLDNPKMIGNPYTYGEATVNLYFPLFWTFYGALSGSAGKFFDKAIEDDARVFYQGGSRSVRGYRFRSIYASYESEDSDGETIINTGLTPMYYRFNQEVRWTLPWKSAKRWQIVQFFDWAKVMDEEKDVYEEEADASLGLGLRYHWQFLTFRLDYAFKKTFLNWDGMESFAWGRFAFDLSHAF